MSIGLARRFVKLDPPKNVILQRGSKRIGARIARTFTEFINGVVSGYNETNGTQLAPAQGLVMILDSNLDPRSLFDQYRSMAEKAKLHVVQREWSEVKGFENAWRWMDRSFAKWFLWHVLAVPYQIDQFHRFEGAPMLKKVLIEHPRGEKFMEDFTLALREFLFPGHED